MFRKTLLLLASFMLIANYALLAQDDEDDSTGGKWYSWGEHEWFDWHLHGKPFVEVSYGFGTPKHQNITSKFANVGLAEIKLGHVSMDTYYEDNIIEFEEKYVFASKISTDLKSSNVSIDEMKSVLDRFGFASRSGYGYKLGQFEILPYHATGFAWSRLVMKTYPSQFYMVAVPPITYDQAVTDTDILNLFQNTFRFGTVWEGGVRCDVSNFFSLNAGYEAAIIFPRHLFGYHLLSFAIEEGGLGLLDHFIDEVGDSSPYAAPVVNFVLKNGFSYLFYSLKKDKMNWPFDTAAPLTYETFKFGVTFTF